jgi:hypothetical protein
MAVKMVLAVDRGLKILSMLTSPQHCLSVLPLWHLDFLLGDPRGQGGSYSEVTQITSESMWEELT